MIVVTGAKGVIGRSVTAHLRAQGVAVKAISRDIFDLSRGKALGSVVKGIPAGVIHLAAAVPGMPPYQDTSETAAITRKIDKCVFDAVELWGCPVVYTSGCSLYNLKDSTFMTEESPISSHIKSPYLRAKADGERLFMALERVGVARVAGLIGKGLPAHVVASRFILTAASGGTIALWGSGMREQDFVNIEDIALALIKMLNIPNNSVINISSGKPLTMLDFARVVIETIGRGNYIINNLVDPREGECARFSNARARELLGWSPMIKLKSSISSMAEILL